MAPLQSLWPNICYSCSQICVRLQRDATRLPWLFQPPTTGFVEAGTFGAVLPRYRQPTAAATTTQRQIFWGWLRAIAVTPYLLGTARQTRIRRTRRVRAENGRRLTPRAMISSHSRASVIFLTASIGPVCSVGGPQCEFAHRLQRPRMRTGHRASVGQKMTQSWRIPLLKNISVGVLQVSVGGFESCYQRYVFCSMCGRERRPGARARRGF